MKKLLIGTLLTVMTFVGLSVYQHNYALANNYPCGNGAYGRNGCQGYSNGQTSQIYSCGGSPCINVDNVLPNGLYDYNVSELFNTIGGINGGGGYLWSTNAQDEDGAAFIVDTMLGVNGGTSGETDSVSNSINYARNNYSAWQASVNYVNSIGGISWSVYEYNNCYSNVSYPQQGCSNANVPNLDSGYSTDKNDDVFHDWIGAWNGGSDNGNAIVFNWPGGQISLGQDCGNVQGLVGGIHNLAPTCTLSASGSGNNYTFTTTIQNISSPNYTFSFGDGNNYGPTGSSSTSHTYNSYGSFSAQVVVNGTSGGQPAQAKCNTTVNIAVPAGCAYQAQPGTYGGQSTLAVCCVGATSASADYTVVGGYSGSVPNASNLPANDPSPLVSIGQPTYQLVSSNPYGYGGSQPTSQTFSYTTGGSLPATYIEPYVSQQVYWSGQITAYYQSYTDYSQNYQYPNPSNPQQYLIGTEWWGPYTTNSSKPTLPSGDQYIGSQQSNNYQPNYQVQFTGQPTVNTQAPCVTMSCGSYSVTPGLAPDPLDSKTSFSITVSDANNYGATPTANMTLRINPVNGGSYSYNGQQATSYGSGYATNSVFSNLGPTNGTGEYQYTWTLTGPNVNLTCGPQQFSVVNLPYLQVYGGDVMAGASPSYNSGVSSCVGYDSGAGVYGWNGLSPYSYAGAGAQYAVQALAQINGFASSQYSANSPPTALSFSNSGTNPPSGLFGTGFSGTIADCDFTRDITAQPLTGDQTLPGTLTNGVAIPSTIPDGQPGQITVYVDGNVYINNPITYDTLGWSSPSQIPYFKLVVVGGNIYIGSNVKQLDGLYVAEPNGAGQGGIIYTCASGNNAPITPTSASYYGTCDNQLVINGAFVATQVQFLRTYDTVGQSNTDNGTPSGSHAAEVFNYTPELWLPRSGANPNGDYSAITGLPPNL